MSKLIYSPTSVLLEEAYEGIKNIDPLHNSVYYSLAFTGDGYFYTHGLQFRLFKVLNNALEGLNFSIIDGLAGVYIDNTAVGTGTVVQGVSGDSIITASTVNGITSLSHALPLTAAQATTYGSTSLIPIITVDRAGHITAISNSASVDTSKVSAAIVSSAGTYYPIGVTDSNLLNPKYNTSIFYDENGNLHATTYYQGNSTLDLLYAPLSHTTVYADDTVYGHVLISDTVDSTLDNTLKTAATPKAVSTALDSAKDYANALVAALDAMVFVGTLEVDGTITSHNNKLLKTIVDGTTNINSINYKVGYTFRFIETGSFNSISVEIGDMLIAVSDKGQEFNINDWTVIQTNISGALTSIGNLDGLLYALNSRVIESLAFSNGVLRYINNALTFVNPNTLWRDIQINGTSIGTDVANLIPSGSITITNNNGDITIGLSTATVLAAAQALTIRKDSNTAFTYAPSTASTLEVGDLLNLRVNSTTGNYVLEHSSVTAITNKLGSITTDGYGHVTSVTEINSLKNPNNLKIRLTSGEILAYDGSAEKVLLLADGDDITFTGSTNLQDLIVITPTVTHKYRGVLFYSTLSTVQPTVLLASNTNTILTLVGGENVSLSSTDANNQSLPAGTLRINAEDTWRDILAYKFASNSFTRSSISDTAMKFGSDFIWDSTAEELSIVWTEIDANGTITRVK